VASIVDLNQEELARYARHISLPEVGLEGQKRLKASSVLLVGAGGLGSPAALYLAAAGVGRIGIVDHDTVDASNLHRQILHGTHQVGLPKVASAAATLSAINPHVHVEQYQERLTPENARRLIEPYDLVLDGTDNFPTRYLVNDACVMLGKPNCYGSILRFEGQAALFGLPGGPCYRCLYPEPPRPGMVPSCAEGGVFGVLPGIIGTIQATEAIKLLLGLGTSLAGRMLLYDALEMRFRQLQIRRDTNCPVCGDRPSIRSLAWIAETCSLPTTHATSHASQSPWDITIEELKQWLDRGDSLVILDVREPGEYYAANLGGTLIPLGQFSARFRKLDRSATYVVHCKAGMRSAQAVTMLRDFGFAQAFNLQGGLDAWMQKYDLPAPATPPT